MSQTSETQLHTAYREEGFESPNERQNQTLMWKLQSNFPLQQPGFFVPTLRQSIHFTLNNGKLIVLQSGCYREVQLFFH